MRVQQVVDSVGGKGLDASVVLQTLGAPTRQSASWLEKPVELAGSDPQSLWRFTTIWSASLGWTGNWFFFAVCRRHLLAVKPASLVLFSVIMLEKEF
jgi:hypothetical protein